MSAKKLVSLAEFQDRAWDAHRVANDPSPQPNGIACPNCGSELLDSEPMMVLASNPPQKSIHCAKCTYRGYRFA